MGRYGAFLGRERVRVGFHTRNNSSPATGNLCVFVREEKRLFVSVLLHVCVLIGQRKSSYHVYSYRIYTCKRTHVRG